MSFIGPQTPGSAPLPTNKIHSSLAFISNTWIKPKADWIFSSCLRSINHTAVSETCLCGSHLTSILISLSPLSLVLLLIWWFCWKTFVWSTSCSVFFHCWTDCFVCISFLALHRLLFTPVHIEIFISCLCSAWCTNSKRGPLLVPTLWWSNEQPCFPQQRPTSMRDIELLSVFSGK